jgi:hypothetical protein
MVMMVILPLKLAFFKIFDTKSRAQERETWYAAVILLDIIFLVDVFLSFFTGTIEQDKNPPQVCGLNHMLACVYSCAHARTHARTSDAFFASLGLGDH